VRLAGTVTLGVCRDICIPVTADVRADLPRPGGPEPRIRRALDGAPEPIAGFATCRADAIADGLRLTVRLPDSLPVGHLRVEAVAVETPDPAVWVSEADIAADGAGLTATVDLVPPTGTPFALDRSALRFTVIAGGWVGEMTGCTAG